MKRRKLSATLGAAALGIAGALVVPAINSGVANAAPLCPAAWWGPVVANHCEFPAPSGVHVACNVGGWGNIVWEHCWGPEGGFVECATGQVPGVVAVRACPERGEWF